MGNKPQQVRNNFAPQLREAGAQHAQHTPLRGVALLRPSASSPTLVRQVAALPLGLCVTFVWSGSGMMFWIESLSDFTVRRWLITYGLGYRLPTGVWIVLEGELRAFLAGRRKS